MAIVCVVTSSELESTEVRCDLPTLSDVEKTIVRHYSPEIWQAVRAGLAIVASLALTGRDHCLVLVFEGGSGRGKSIGIRVVMPDRPETEAVLERVDDFTPASFVSHASNRNQSQLAKIDLLPRVKGKVMLTKELAPLFRDAEEELRQNFARLTSVLDGDGYKTNSGTQGARGYVGRYVFNWIGATTPIPESTHRIMAQLGNRILFYEVASDEFTEDELVEFAAEYEGNDAVEECRTIVNGFVEGFFQRHPPESVDPHSITIPPDSLREIVRYAKLISHGRVEVNFNESGDAEAGGPEGPHRVILLLQTLVQGLALVEGRLHVTREDLGLIRHIALSSIPDARRKLIHAVLAGGGALNASQAEAALDRSRPTVLRSMKELDATGICQYTPGDPNTSTPGKISLAADWQWLLTR